MFVNFLYIFAPSHRNIRSGGPMSLKPALIINGLSRTKGKKMGTFTTIDLSLCSLDILMAIDFMVESDSYGSDHFRESE